MGQEMHREQEAHKAREMHREQEAYKAREKMCIRDSYICAFLIWISGWIFNIKYSIEYYRIKKEGLPSLFHIGKPVVQMDGHGPDRFILITVQEGLDNALVFG